MKHGVRLDQAHQIVSVAAHPDGLVVYEVGYDTLEGDNHVVLLGSKPQVQPLERRVVYVCPLALFLRWGRALIIRAVCSGDSSMSNPRARFFNSASIVFLVVVVHNPVGPFVLTFLPRTPLPVLSAIWRSIDPSVSSCFAISRPCSPSLPIPPSS